MLESQKIKQIIKKLQETQPSADTKIIGDAFQFLKKEIKDFPIRERKRTISEALENAISLAELKPRPKIIAAALLFKLAEIKPECIKKISNKLSKDIARFLKANNLTKKLSEKHNLNRRHFIATAKLLAELKLSLKTVTAGLLHNLPFYNVISKEELRKEFGQEIYDLVISYQNISNLKPLKSAHHVRDLREMFLALSKDLRVVLIKICSVLDALKHIEEIPEKHRESLAKEAMDVFAKIADLLGIWRIRWQLEDYAFKFLMPTEYQTIEQQFNVDERKNREKYIYKYRKILEREFKSRGIKAKIDGRFKHFFSIHNKMKDKQRGFDKIYDVLALRVIVPSSDDCYRALGMIHNLWSPKNRRFKDYIAAPKENNYRSLHTTVFGLNGRPTEFQIRTEEMNEEAKFGIASHWYYKNTPEQTPQWIKELIDQQHRASTDEEFLENVNTKILINKIYIYTPKGDIIDLPEGATPIDFAYHIHTDIGHRYESAIINGVPVPIDTRLNSGDVTQIITTKDRVRGPNIEWLKIVKTPSAERHIKKYFEENTQE